jgi:ABC-2 type transport system permease protein
VIGLIRAEMLRARSRRMLRFSVLGLFGTLLFVMSVAWIVNDKPTGSEAEQFERLRAAEIEFVEACKAGFPNGVPDGPASSFFEPGSEPRIPPQFCDEVVEGYFQQSYNRGLEMRNFEGFLFGYLPPLFALMLMFGASFVGGDWASRAITQALIYEPRRMRLLAAKGVAIGVTAAVVFVVFLLSVLAAVSLVATFKGTFDGFSLSGTIGTILRLGALGSVVALVGSLLAAVTRSTGGTFGVAFVYLVVVEPFVVGWKPWIGRWLFFPNGLALTIAEPLVEFDGTGEVAFSQSHLWQSALVLAGILAVASLVVGTLFKRREIA